MHVLSQRMQKTPNDIIEEHTNKSNQQLDRITTIFFEAWIYFDQNLYESPCHFILFFMIRYRYY